MNINDWAIITSYILSAQCFIVANRNDKNVLAFFGAVYVISVLFFNFIGK